jgi:heme-degrading monooxygenase HmoA
MSAELIPGRRTAAAEGDLVVFHIGMRINRFRALRSWWPVSRAMPRMLRELSEDKESGFLGARLLSGGPRLIYVVQYWESKEKLIAYASDQDRTHRPAWAAFNRRARAAKGAVGVWHETFAVPAGSYESIYVDMPAFGLAAATGVIPVGHRGEHAAERLARRAARTG